MPGDPKAYDQYRTRCRRLGHPVPFSYCRDQGNGRACADILDCWWESFPVEAHLREHWPAELERARGRRPQSKLGTIVDLINRARSASESSS